MTLLPDLISKLRSCYDRRELPTWGEISAAANEIERLNDALVELIQDRQAAADLHREALKVIHSALDDALGDSDITHIENDDELRDAYPVQWAAQKIAELIGPDDSDDNSLYYAGDS